MRLLIERVQFQPEGLDIVWRDEGWREFAAEMANQPLVVEQKMEAEEVTA